eukprot:13770765-Ditylum_brightwellii.AAC.1
MEAVGGGSVVAAVVTVAVLVVGASDEMTGLVSCCACKKARTLSTEILGVSDGGMVVEAGGGGGERNSWRKTFNPVVVALPQRCKTFRRNKN